mmetsp:Transcript_25109/g.63122  ORF Transcript_25109/g.63122 Transcript_25109/m.63122 type:complete len:211 (+) Transcript_25109:481-1113(+)
MPRAPHHEHRSAPCFPKKLSLQASCRGDARQKLRKRHGHPNLEVPSLYDGNSPTAGPLCAPSSAGHTPSIRREVLHLGCLSSLPSCHLAAREDHPHCYRPRTCGSVSGARRSCYKQGNGHSSYCCDAAPSCQSRTWSKTYDQDRKCPPPRRHRNTVQGHRQESPLSKWSTSPSQVPLFRPVFHPSSTALVFRGAVCAWRGVLAALPPPPG